MSGAALLAGSPYGSDFAPDPATVIARNQQWSVPGVYNTPLQFNQETQFRKWVGQERVPFDPNAASSDYDMRGFWQSLQAGDPRATRAIDPNDNRLHYPDYWKTPTHETFSNQSQWATPDAPMWTPDDRLVDKKGQVLFDDKANNTTSINPITGLPEFNFSKNLELSNARRQQQSMSQTMMPPPQGGQPPQIPPQVLAMLMQRMQQGGQGAPQMPSQGAPPMMPPGGAMRSPMPPPQMQGPMGPPNMANPGQTGGGPPVPPGMPGQGMPPPPIPQPGQQPMTAQQMAQQGRADDQIIGHLSPGEVTIPPQIQTPQLMAAIREAFGRFGINPAQFTAGSPAASRNPATGAPEFNFLSALLPVLGAVGGGYFGGPAGAAIGGGLGGAAQGAMNGDQTAGILASGAGGALGGYIGAPTESGATTALGDAAATPATISDAAASAPAASAASGSGIVASGAAPDVKANPFGTGSIKDIFSGLQTQAKPGIYAGIGSSLGGALAPNTNTNNLPPGFNTPLPAVNTSLARGAGNATTPQFANYNPYQAVTGAGGSPGYNFFPSS